MCLICVEYEKEKLTISEARRNLEEMKEKVGDSHYNEVKTMLIQKELEKSWEAFLGQDFEFGRDIEDGLFDDEYWEKIGFGD
jgi:hypothetical protein|tara:strand:+ start:1176 stop:1421 length:246 start_codon:yes stop_codon:yes gene_type:complete